MSRQRPKVSIVSLGCSKNLIDSERLSRRLSDAGIDVHFADRPAADGSVVVINTCGFIGDAKEESVETIMSAVGLKQANAIKGIYVMGCLSERYRQDLTAEIPELDGIYGKFDWDAIVARLAPKPKAVSRPWERTLSTGPHFAYVKISEGCNRFCAFCAIPLITGRHHSRPADEIVAEVEELARKGTREFNIIAQDLSSYGRDLPDAPEAPLADLLRRLSDIEGVEMIRLHYAYPSDFPYEILPVMAERKNICKYLDIALQHIDDKVLDNMLRHIDSRQTEALLNRIRAEVPGIHIRTTMMVGFPGEDEAAFERLLDFVRRQRFERLGAFAYCEEEDTYSARNYSDDISQDVKDARLERLMAVQQDISREIAEAKRGQTLRVIIDERDGDQWIGRTEFDSPEVDGNVYVSSDRPLEIGRIYNILITDSDDFDLWGQCVDDATAASV